MLCLILLPCNDWMTVNGQVNTTSKCVKERHPWRDDEWKITCHAECSLNCKCALTEAAIISNCTDESVTNSCLISISRESDLA